ncbi:unnamed protein product [Tuber aestivum]|uniref:ERCC4 domain-containing protein n=1 Tax=Tuber aestivum TaxID=59557 RepID=A0A292Q4K7_9PEZI|nr:unnamed protein product [Tuber aestivum]
MSAALDSSPAAAQKFLEAQARTVKERCPDRSLSDIRLDLLYTGGTRATLERILEGRFLCGTARDPRRPSVLRRAAGTNKGASNGIPIIDLSEDTPVKLPLSPATAKRNLAKAYKGKGKEIANSLRAVSKSPLFRSSAPEGDLELLPDNVPSPYRALPPLRDRTPEFGGSPLLPLSSTAFSTQSTPFSSGHPNPYATSPLQRPISPTPMPVTLLSSAMAQVLHRGAAYSASPTPRKRAAPESDGSDIEVIEPPLSKFPPLSKRSWSGASMLDSDSGSVLNSLPSAPGRPLDRGGKSGDSILDLVSESGSENSSSGDGPGTYISKSYSEELQELLRTEPEKRGKRKSAAAVATEGVSPKRRRKVSAEVVDEDIPTKPTKISTRITGEERARRAAEREEARQAKKREKEAKDAEKELQKAARKQEKEAKELEKKREQDFLSANKLRSSKRDSVPEMVADISMFLADTPTGEQLQRFLLELGCKVNPTWVPPLPGNLKLVKWRRRVKADFDEGLGMFVPLESEQIRHESHILVYLTAKEFTDTALPLTASRLPAHVQKMKSALPTPPMQKPTRLIYLIEGLQALIRKHRNLQNRAYQTRVLSHLPSAPNIPGASTALGTDDDTLINEDDVEDALLDLQITHNCLIHHTSSPVETAEWITIFTGDISTIPYSRHSRAHLDTSFCAEVGQVKPGLGKRDTYRKMLQEITRITPGISAAIAKEYPDVRRLVHAIEHGGGEVLAGIENSSTRNGLQSSRTVGAACSRRIAGVFLGRDPLGVDV